METYGSRVKKNNAREPHDASHPRQSHSKDAKREGRTSSWNQLPAAGAMVIGTWVT